MSRFLPAVVALALPLTLGLCELARRMPLTRFLFGMKGAPRGTLQRGTGEASGEAVR